MTYSKGDIVTEVIGAGEKAIRRRTHIVHADAKTCTTAEGFTYSRLTGMPVEKCSVYRAIHDPAYDQGGERAWATTLIEGAAAAALVLAFFVGGAAILSLGGCSSWPSGQQATEPSTFEATRITVWPSMTDEEVDAMFDPVPGPRQYEKVTHRGPGNEKKSGAYEWVAGGSTFKHGSSSAIPFDWEVAISAVDAWPATIIGGILIVVGAALVYFGQRTIGIILIAAGGCAIALPFVAETVRLILLIAGLVLIVAGGIYCLLQLYKDGKALNLFRKATGPTAQAKLKGKGDKAGAAAAAYAETLVSKGEAAAKEAAKAVKA